MNKTVRDTIDEYQFYYKMLSPDNKSVAIAEDLWNEWKKSGQIPPDISGIATDYAKWENGFFYDMVTLARRMENKDLSIHYCAFCLDQYNFYAVTAKDGYIVLVDDYFFQLLFVLSTILMSYAQGWVAEYEQEKVQKLTREIIINNYFNRQRFKFEQDTIFAELLSRDYDNAEFSNYFFSGLKAFILAHEFGHHILEHKKGIVNRTFSMLENQQTIEVDERSISDEFAADIYGYRLFEQVSDTVDESIYYAFCGYKFKFAPLFLFDLFEKLDQATEKYYGITKTYNTHPHPRRRYDNLMSVFDIDAQDQLYIQMKEAMDIIFEPLIR